MPYAGVIAPEGWLLCNGAEYSRTDYASLWSVCGQTFTATVSNGSTTVTVASTTSLAVGSALYGPFPAGAVITAINSSTTFTSSAAANSSGSGVSVTTSIYDRQINPTTGASWGAPTTGNFRVPDYRASFLRGVGAPSVGDAVVLGGWQLHKTAKNSLALSNPAVTSLGQSQGHSHGVNQGGSGSATNTNLSHRHAVYTGDVDDQNFTHAWGQNPTADGPGVHWTGVYTDYQLGDHSHTISVSTSVSLNNNNVDHTHSVTPTTSLGNGDTETRPHNKGVNYIIKV